MNFFLGIIPDNNANCEIRKVVGEIAKVFNGQQIPVRWVNPETFHVTLLFVGKNISHLELLILRRKIKKITFKQFKISFKSVELGISKRYKELVYLSIDSGEEEMRLIAKQLDSKGSIRGANSFTPHLTLGRVSKELTDEEYRNLSRDLSMVSKNLNIRSISFNVKEISLIKSEDGSYNVLIRCLAS